ncbi:MAG: hypothetical protein V1824_01485 [archaeon]
MKTNKSAVLPLFNAIIIFVMAIIFIGILLSFAISYFNNLTDLKKMEINKNNLLTIYNSIYDIKSKEAGSYENIYLDAIDFIEIDSNDNTLIIKQKINNELLNKIREETTNSISISKENNEIVFNLDINSICDINRSYVLGLGKQELKIEIDSKTDSRARIDISRVN